MLKAGRYEATLVDSRLDVDKGGLPKPVLVFSVKDEAGATQTIEWTGSFKSPKAEEMAYNTLVTAGWATNQLADLKAGVNPLTFMPVDLDVTIEEHEYNGKTYPRVKWVNPRMAKKEFKGQLPDVAAKVAAARARLGQKPVTAAQQGDDPF